MSELFGLTADGRQVVVRDDGPEEERRRIALADRLGDWCDAQHGVMAEEAGGRTPYAKHLPAERALFFCAVVPAICRMRTVLCA